jgi:hypothetical protein
MSSETMRMPGSELGEISKRSHHRLVLLLLGVTTGFSLALLFRGHRPSQFSAGSGYGAGHGVDSLMVGASPRKGVSK